MNEPNTFFQDISIQRRVAIAVGILSVLIVVTGLYGLIAVVETNHRLHKSVLEGQMMMKTVDTARVAQVHFKKQVQEWKNILLRGNDQNLYNQYLRGFENEERLVNESLRSLRELTDSLRLVVPQVNETIRLHEQLGRQYREALNAYKQHNLKSAVIVDKIVRGIDRGPTDRIDQIVDTIKQQAEKRLSETEMIAKTKIEGYQGLAVFLIFLVLAGIGFSIFSACSIVHDLTSQREKSESEDV